ITGVYDTKMQVLALRCGSSEFLLPKLKEQAGKLLADLKEIKQPTLRQELLLWQVRYYIKHIESQQLKNELRDQRIMLENNNKKIFNKKQN
ncbi:MAG: hypothetical protein PHV82_12365, partial [Victivallaceae bacterium]|nr:hypothetical protein [Victivallaceae bacterium]